MAVEKPAQKTSGAIEPFKPPTKPPEQPTDHTWFIADEQRYCTRCGHVQTRQPGFEGLWQPDPPYPMCDAVLPISNAADLRTAEQTQPASLEEQAQQPNAAPTPEPAAAKKPQTKAPPPLRYKK